jgi:hypothetical protein
MPARSPLGTGPDGSSRLAALLAGRGVPVERQTSSLDTVREAMRAEATVFIPAPGLVNANLVRLLAALPIAHRIVLVEPGRRDQFALPVANLGTRWASLAVPPGCDNAWARAAGRASALRTRYDAGPNGSICYGGGLVGARLGRAELFVVGASDLFRNGRIGEHGNARLATDLLAGKPRVLWLTGTPREGYLLHRHRRAV